MDPFAGYAALDNPQQFWTELDDILHTQPQSSSSNDPQAIIEAKRVYVSSILAKFLHLCAASFNDNLTSEYNQDYCINRLFSSFAFKDDAQDTPMHQLSAEEAIRIMQTSTSIPMLLMTYEIVLQYGEAFPSTYKSIQASASTVSFVGVRAFLHRLVHQIWAGSYAAQAEAKIGISDSTQSSSNSIGWNGAQWDENGASSTGSATYISKGLSSSSASKDIAVQISLREKAVRMLYEVCRVQKLEPAHLKAFDERFIHHLFDLVEETRHHHDEDFNYRLIKLLVAMNEQYMVSTLAPSSSGSSATRPQNLVLSVLQQRLNASKTFGENLIFMLNRASSSDAEDVCMQLLVLKLLYLLFTTKETACYFYTNDLRVLVDIFIRELHDLPDESESLRHTYLRVLHPLLTNTQLCSYPYKRPQIRRLLNGLLAHGHLRDISATTTRLVERCLRAEWCVELDRLDGTERIVTVEPVGGGEKHDKVMQPGVTTEGLPMLATKIKENSNQVQATADSLAITTDETVASPISITTTGSSTDSEQLSVPPLDTKMRTRDKRVASLSSPRSPSSDESGSHLRPSTGGGAVGSMSLGSASGKSFVRRTVSAQSAPCTPPRVDSPAPHAAIPVATRRLSPNNTDDDAMSTSSSWHAHMTEDPNHAGPTPSCRRRASDAEAGSGEIPHVSQVFAVQESCSPRVGSPLSTDSTMQVLDAVTHPMHTQDSSESTIGPPKRRKPPQPPSIAVTRRAMQLSSSEPHSLGVSPAGSRSSSPMPEEGGAGGAKGGGGIRRRPPPPPPAPAASNAASQVVTPTSERGEEDEMANAQSFYIAERLRRGLRIR